MDKKEQAGTTPANRQPKLMSLSRMRNLLAPHQQLLREQIFINNELAVIHGDPHIFRIIMQQQPPFSINDFRLGMLLNGHIHASLNLMEKHLAAGTLIFLGPGTIITPLDISDDVEICGFGISPDFALPFGPGQLPAAFNGQAPDFQLPASEGDLATARHIIDTLWHVVRQPEFDHALVSSLVAAQMEHYNTLFCRYTAQQQGQQSRAQTVFNRFIYLINRHAVRERRMAFYASKMCLTERYLGTVVRQASGITAKEWLDRAITARIKVELRHSDKTIAQIAYETGFPNPSFFCKYFRRVAGLTPADFRNQKEGKP